MSDHAWTYTNITFSKRSWMVAQSSTENVWQALDRLGAEGWEMVQCLPDADLDRHVIVLKKKGKTKKHS